MAWLSGSGLLAAFSSVLLQAGLGLGIDCPLPLTAGRSVRWPPTNPALAAPVSLVHHSHEYRQPLEAELTADSISIPVPPDFFAGFNMTDAQGTALDQFALRSIVLRKPGRVAEGASQVISHVLEMVLLHEAVSGEANKSWSSVVVPFSVELGTPPDMLSALLAGSRLPTKYGERSPVLMSSAQALSLAAVFSNATFLTYWTSLPTKCTDVSRPVRQFMRTSSLVTSPSAFEMVLAALRSVPDAPPLPAADAAWLTTSCTHADVTSGQCAAQLPTDLDTQLSKAQRLQSTAVSKVRAAKQDMDAALVALQSVTNVTYQGAIQAREALRAATAALDGAGEQVEQLESWKAQAKANAWQENPPSALAAAGGSLSSFLATAQLRSKRAAGNATSDCLALRRSPIAILSADVSREQASWKVPKTPVAFGRGEAPATPVPLQLYNTGEYVRMVVPAGAGSPLGTVQRGKQSLDVVFADLHVPGEHSIDGHTAAVEVQLVHLPKGGGAAVAVALRLQEGGEGSAYDNPWVAALLSQLPPASSEAKIPPPAEGVQGLHSALARGEATRYFRYDGTLTRAPCRTAEWFVLEEPGTVSSRQLAALRAALPRAPSAGAAPSLAAASLIAEGVQDFPAPSTVASPSLLGKWSAKQRSIHAL